VTDPDLSWLRKAITDTKVAAERQAVTFGAGWDVRRNDDDGFDYTVHGTDPDEAVADTWRVDAATWIADNDPRSVIARCEAELAILEEHGIDDTFGDGDFCCSSCGDVPQVPWPCKTVRLLAAGYKYRPGWAEAGWAPEGAERA
jgi:hypothetical protein